MIKVVSPNGAEYTFEADSWETFGDKLFLLKAVDGQLQQVAEFSSFLFVVSVPDPVEPQPEEPQP